MFLLPNLILLYQKILDQLLGTILLREFQTNENFNKLHLIIHQILTLKTLLLFTNLLKNHLF